MSTEGRPYGGMHERGESYSSGSPFNDEHSPPLTSYPPTAGSSRPLLASGAVTPGQRSASASGAAPRHVQIDEETMNQSFRQYDAARAQTYPIGAAARSPGVQMPMPRTSDDLGTAGTPSHRNSRVNGSWDLLAGMRKFEQGYEQFDSRNASQPHLAFADGDMPQGKVCSTSFYARATIAYREGAHFGSTLADVPSAWTLIVIPILALLWIPGILGFTRFPESRIYGIKLVFWSIWLSVVWLGWWSALAVCMILPPLLRNTLGIIIVTTRKYIDWFEVLYRYAAFAGWSILIFVSYQPLINATQETNSTTSQQSVDTLSKLLFALMLSACVLFGEKLAIQFIASKFHERSYADRITDQKFAVRVLVTLYQHSTDIPWRSDTLRDGPTGDSKRKSTFNPQKVFKKALKGVRSAATTTTTVLGTVASEIAGTSVLQPNSPQAIVKTALESANKSRLLARRLFYSFAQPGADHLRVEDIDRFFRSREESDAAFAIFDKDMNGDVTRDEIEMACMELHREQLSIEHSMRDLDSAVGRLDNILMSLYFVVVILIFAVALEAQLATLITSAGTLILGLSWLIGGSLAEVLTSIIFLFIKHPYDVGDRVAIGEKTYTVKEMRLLSTIFLDSNGCQTQAPNTWINTQLIHNIRRSPQMSETFEFDVAYDTTFDQIERLRDVMLSFLKTERRDFQPAFDVYVVDIPGQEKMTLRADIKYKSNWQQGTLKAQRRNKWICALKASLTKVKIFGPKGDPDRTRRAAEAHSSVPLEGVADEGTDRAVDPSQDVFGENDQLYMTGPRQTPAVTPGVRSRPMTPGGSAMPPVSGLPPTSGLPPVPAMPTPATMPVPSTSARQSPRQPHRQPPLEEIELKTPRADQQEFGH
ncbi:hypothetical protein BN946_scf184994.g14 [Trametes cinnabarina]|uniref:EF-hand domain-containing protein n=1 Tax=Pycnoporus cinnabarinus TaxID=5643 RepID=A0A060SEX5_PYCCI|nr:hypothetical protein BN946_scf184994.g14 [Trametes cinnabarina]